MFFLQRKLETLPNEQDYENLLQAIVKHQTPDIERLLAKGVQPECSRWQKANNLSCLYCLITSRSCHEDQERMALFDRLVEKGADPYFVFPSGYNLLHTAAIECNKVIIEHLLKNYAFNINAAANTGTTALHLTAAWCKNISIFQLLLDYGANPLLINKYGNKASNLVKDSAIKQLLINKEKEWRTKNANLATAQTVNMDDEADHDAETELTHLIPSPPGGM